MSQLIELLWRNRAYVEGTLEPDSGQPERKGAMFAGFSSEMAFDNQSGRPIQKTRQEYLGYDRVCVYPGTCRDSKYDYNIGPEFGIDPASIDLPAHLQYPRTIKTDVFNTDNQIDAKAGVAFGTSMSKYQNTPALGAAKNTGWEPTAAPFYNTEPGMMIRKRARNAVDESVVTDQYAVAGFVPDLNYANAGDTTVSIDLAESIAGVGSVLKKITVQCSKANHHISEITLDFSDITRGSGSISSSENPQANLLTILLDGTEKVKECYFDCKMGKFGSNKFKLGLKSVKYFPPLACPSGGFDPGSQVAVPGDVTFGCERLYDLASAESKEPYVRRENGADSYPNPLRGATNASDHSLDSHHISGARNVGDAVNQGYNIVGLGKTTHSSTSYDGSILAKEENLTTTAPNSNAEIAPSPWTDTANIQHSRPEVMWKMAGCSSYTFKPREVRGTILAINVVLQADASML